MTGRVRRPISRPGRATVRLYCLAHAGGDARAFAPWSVLLPDHIEVCPIQLPGRGERLPHPPVDTLEAALDQIHAAISTTLPFALFGHSLGAVLAYEAAHRRTPAHLFISGHRAPHLPLREQSIHHLPDREFIARLAELNGTPQVLLENPNFLRMLLPTMRADFKISETYRHRPRPPLPCPLTVLGATEDPDVHRSELEAWTQHTSANCRITEFPGDHFYLFDHPEPPLTLISEALAAFAPAHTP
ncbi:thioesterase [Nocardia panacis]|uniref:Thioesterase TesA n=1 Tax=Nocardia panacis TaxID=2340916 RepID=A0A3A4K6F0_9NOCA|nr:alpha/beta fold hydrolase [Nocardia panacis]RJO70060.1 thioesterase [Nocardia panacis]